MRLHKTGHEIADTVSDLIGDLPDGDYRAAYGILRHRLFEDCTCKWFELDKGFWGSSHYDGNYRLSYKGTQPEYDPKAPHKEHGLSLETWRANKIGRVMICPPTESVRMFFNIDYAGWLWWAVPEAGKQGNFYFIRNKGDKEPINWDIISAVVTFNSTIGFEALRRGIPVISDPIHSTIGSYTSQINSIDGYDRDELFSFAAAHQFKLDDKESIKCLIEYYLST